ncbi:MAG TPA: SGNH/GDSL hydrolase family protein [Thermoanaerobaculia bacterium]|nr:SGNH/GDSL hydrolase family protein [Thermoanaerobaculia bacterium]
MKLLALGDSYTIGEGVAATERWPVLLASELRFEPPLIIARTGWTTDELNAAIDEADLHPPFELVTLLIGVNDQYRGREVEEYRRGFRVLLQRAIGFAGDDASRVIIVSIPDWGVTPFAEGRDRGQIAAEIDRFNDVNQKEAARSGARYANITALSREGGAHPSLNASDGLHPSAAMYQRWLTIILREARLALAGG